MRLVADFADSELEQNDHVTLQIALLQMMQDGLADPELEQNAHVTLQVGPLHMMIRIRHL